MSAIDRAFIKAYSEDSAETPQQSARPARRTKAANRAPSSADTKQAAAPQARRTTNRTKRSVAAAALSAAPPPMKPSATANDIAIPVAAPSIVAPTAVPATKPTMVVGRRALAQLAEGSTVPTPHTAFAKRSSVTPVQICDDSDLKSDVAATPQANYPAISPSTVDRPKMVVSHRATENRSMPADQQPAVQYRLDKPVRMASVREQTPAVREQKSEPARAPLAMSAATAAKPEPIAIRPISASLPQANSVAPLAALEVDRFAFPPTCNAMIETARGELESALGVIEEQGRNGVQTVAVVSSDEREGCTTVVMCLAQMLATRGARICLVDAAFHQPRMAERLGLEPERGFEALFAGEATLGEVLVESLEDQLTLLPLATAVTANLVERSKLRQQVTFGELRDHFDMVLVDAGCLGMPTTRRPSILECGSIDAAILVRVENADTSGSQRARRSLAQLGVPCLGVIENRCL